MNEFINQWVAPYYLQILQGNYCFNPKYLEQTAFNQKVKEALQSINANIIEQLLSGGWREQLTGSWFCGLKGWSQFADVIGTKLVDRNVPYAGQGHSFALACFANDKSVEYLTKYLDLFLPQTDLVYEQIWVMPALLWVDAQNNTTYSERYLVIDGLWQNYAADKSTWYQAEPEGRVWQLGHLDDRQERFWQLMKYCHIYFAKPKAG